MVHIPMKNKTLIVFAISSAVFFAGNTVDIFAVEQSTIINSKIITNGDLYVESKTPIQIPFSVTATDGFNNPIPVECDKTSKTMFMTGKTTVRCMAVDSFGNETRDSFVVTVGYDIVQIPDWLKQITQFWISGNIPDNQYFQTLSFLLDEQIIHVPYTKTPKNNGNYEIPTWIKTNAEKWVNGNLSDDEFSIGMQWMLNQKII
jgi:hypothetical protein